MFTSTHKQSESARYINTNKATGWLEGPCESAKKIRRREKRSQARKLCYRLRFLVKGISPAIYAAKVRTSHAVILSSAAYTLLLLIYIQALMFSSFSSIVDPSRTRALRSEPVEKDSTTWSECMGMNRIPTQFSKTRLSKVLNAAGLIDFFSLCRKGVPCPRIEGSTS